MVFDLCWSSNPHRWYVGYSPLGEQKDSRKRISEERLREELSWCVEVVGGQVCMRTTIPSRKRKWM